MPRQRRRRSDRKTNVFVQSSSPEGRDEVVEDDIVDEEEAPESGSTNAVATSRGRRMRAQRNARQARVRSEVFTRSISKELRKLGVLSGVIVVVLAVLTVTL